MHRPGRRRRGVVGADQRDPGLVGDGHEVVQLDRVADRPRGDRRRTCTPPAPPAPPGRAGRAGRRAPAGRARARATDHAATPSGSTNSAAFSWVSVASPVSTPVAAIHSIRMAGPARPQRRPDRGELEHQQEVLGHQRARQLDEHRDRRRRWPAPRAPGPPPKASSATSPSSPTLTVPITAWATRSGGTAVLPPACVAVDEVHHAQEVGEGGREVRRRAASSRRRPCAVPSRCGSRRTARRCSPAGYRSRRR